MARLVRNILKNELRDDCESSKQSSLKMKKNSFPANREKREDVELSPALFQALKATVDDQQRHVKGGEPQSPIREARSSSDYNLTTTLRSITSMPEGISIDETTDKSTTELVESIITGSDDPALLEALYAMMEESEGDTTYHKETLALVAESIKQKQAAKQALERVAETESRLQKSLQRVSPDMIQDTSEYLNNVDSITAGLHDTKINRKSPISVSSAIKKKHKEVVDVEQVEQRDDSVEDERDDQPKRRKNKYKGIVHKEAEIVLGQSNCSYDQFTLADTLEDGQDTDTQPSGTTDEDYTTFQESQTNESSSGSQNKEGHGEEGTKIEYALFELESNLSLSACSSRSDCTGRVSNDHNSYSESSEAEESDTGITEDDQSESDDEEEEHTVPFFTALCTTVATEDPDGEEEESEGEEDVGKHRGRSGRSDSPAKEETEVSSSFLKFVSGYFVQGDADDYDEALSDRDIDDEIDEDIREGRSRSRRRRRRTHRRGSERRSSHGSRCRSSRRHRHRRHRHPSQSP